MLYAGFGKPVGGPFASPVVPGAIPPVPGFNKSVGTFGAIPPIPPIPGFGPTPPFNPYIGTFPGICPGCI